MVYQRSSLTTSVLKPDGGTLLRAKFQLAKRLQRKAVRTSDDFRVGSFFAQFGNEDVVAGVSLLLARVRYAVECAYFSRAAPTCPTMSDKYVRSRPRRAGRPPAGAKEGERVKDYPQLSVRVPVEMKARLNALSAVTGLAQWRIIVEAIDCFHDDLPPTDRELVDGLSERLLRVAG